MSNYLLDRNVFMLSDVPESAKAIVRELETDPRAFLGLASHLVSLATARYNLSDADARKLADYRKRFGKDYGAPRKRGPR